MQRIENLPIARGKPFLGYGAAIPACAVACAIRVLAVPYLPSGYPFVTFFPAVMLIAVLFGTGPGIFTAVLSWALAQYFFIVPAFGFAMGRDSWAAFLFYAIVVGVDIGIIALLQRANAYLRTERELSVRRSEVRELMFHELQHRVSNKLQLIASLLTLQRRRTVDPDAQRALEAAAMRVGMIGRISRALHDPDRQGMGVSDFLDAVGRDIIEASGARGISLHVDADDGIELPADAGVPVALIVAETISNAIEHGFGSDMGGTIRIAVRRGAAGDLHIRVDDDGHGLPPNFDPVQSGSLGLTIAAILARQLGGSFALSPAGARGTVADLRVAG